MKKLILLITLILAVFSVFGRGKISIKLDVETFNKNDEGIQIEIFVNSIRDKSIKAKRGKVNLELDFNKDYDLVIMKKGYVSKHISVNTEVPSSVLNYDNDFPAKKIDITLYPVKENVDISIFNEPVEKLYYSSTVDDIIFDEEYADLRENKIKDTEKLLALKSPVPSTETTKVLAEDKPVRKKERSKEDTEVNKTNKIKTDEATKTIRPIKKSIKEKTAKPVYKAKTKDVKPEIKRYNPLPKYTAKENKEYNSYIQKGDKALADKSYANSRFYYTRALQIKKEEEYPRNKIEEINNIFKQQKLKKEEKTFQEFLDKGNKFFNDKLYVTARFYYLNALKIKKTDQYILDQLDEIEKKLKRQK